MKLNKSLKGRFILSAEDNDVNQIVLEHTLSEQEVPFMIVSNGLEALEAWRELDPLLILMDISMPVMNGLDAISHIRAEEMQTGKHVPIIAVTAHALTGDKERMLSGGADYYLTKPLRACLCRVDSVSFRARI